MSLMLSSCTVASFLHIKLCNLIPQTHSPSELRNFVLPCKVQLGCRTKSFSRSLSYKLLHFSSSVAQASTDSKPQLFTEDDTESFEREDHNNVEDVGSPWEGAIIYKRNPSITHVEYCTTLERLGLGRLSTEISKSKASAIGLRVTKSVKDYPHGTPVQISIDVTRKKQKLRLDGIIKTVITLDCNRCAEPAAELVFSNFSLLLTEQPIDEPDIIDMGTVYGADKYKPSKGNIEEDDDDSIDWDDRLHFPPEEKEIDISKNIRDTVHVEITITAICDPKCKGACLKCGTNLNTSKCNCSKEQVLQEQTYGPLGNLRKRMEGK
ncbi:large ribosomal RNA subunit accumulation protein YCED homolog 1, chloroplastic isoform X2 [Mangifera indica]|nr:large ribosomal RNA subunit accumulation protein YCED homolog 1, chloroplastic isoform X2 [Mangifera indica]XP_044487985.1 large ribosomal RNA subunit accumulation protein YCED homolog 1, chloroplastic isoform X2 [Mangifera indica]XP_044487986.1 large ribosomal RNA subunit accumulation protein YCED homolog 1, chloroplastic isoform X2 [Mangifera indica]